VTWIAPEDEASLAGALQTARERGPQRMSYDLAPFSPQRALTEIDAFYRAVLARPVSD
jgi:hypothetical protein